MFHGNSNRPTTRHVVRQCISRINTNAESLIYYKSYRWFLYNMEPQLSKKAVVKERNPIQNDVSNDTHLICHGLPLQTYINDLVLVVGDVLRHVHVLHLLDQVELDAIVDPRSKADEAALVVEGEVGDVHGARAFDHERDDPLHSPVVVDGRPAVVHQHKAVVTIVSADKTEKIGGFIRIKGVMCRISNFHVWAIYI